MPRKVNRPKQVNFRMPADLIEEFDEVAKAQGRTRTKQLEIILRKYLAGELVPAQPEEE